MKIVAKEIKISQATTMHNIGVSMNEGCCTTGGCESPLKVGPKK